MPPIYPTRPVRFPSPRSGLTDADAIAAHAPTKRTDTEAGSGEKPVRLKSAADEFRQSIRIDIGGLEMRAQEGKGSRFEAARKFCELLHSLLALTSTSAGDKLAALADIDAAVNTLDARFPGVFVAAKNLAVSARETILISEDGRAGAATASSSSSPSASDIASLRAAESTKVTLPPLKMHVEPAGPLPLKAIGVQGLGRTFELVENVAKLSADIEKFLEELLPLHSSHLSGRLLTGEVAALIDQIALHGRSGDAALFAKLGRGLRELGLTHKDPEMRAEMSKVLGCCFEPGDTGPIRAITGEMRLRLRVAFVLTEAPKIAHGAYTRLEEFVFKLVDDIKRDLGDGSPLMVELFDGFDRFDESSNLNQLAEAMYRRS